MLRKIGLAGITTGLIISNQFWRSFTVYSPITFEHTDAMYVVGFLAMAVGAGLLVTSVIVRE